MADYKSLEHWGRAKAKGRYGDGKQGLGPNVEIQENQAPESKHDPNYDNDTNDGWLRGMGKGHAEGKPNFDRKRSG